MSFAANGEAGDSLTDDVVEVGSIIINSRFFFFLDESFKNAKL